MTTPRLIIGKQGGVGRVRFSKAGYDVTDLDLTNEQLVFDSAWPEILGVHAMNLDTGSLGTTYLSLGGYYRRISDQSFPSLPFAPLALGWAVDYTISNASTHDIYYIKRYIPACVCTTTNYIRLTRPGGAAGSQRYAYIVFNKPLFGADPREADLDGGNSMLLGNHPTRGAGLWVSRKGADVLTCGDNDLTLSTLKPMLQVAESGVVTGYVHSTGYLRADIFTSRSYPAHPPVLIRGATQPWGMANASSISTSEYGWLSDNWVHVEAFSGGTADPLHWTILDYDQSYVPGPDAAPTPRVQVKDGVLKVSKKNIDVTTAGDGDLLLRTDRSVLHVKDRLQQDFLFSGSVAGNIPLSTNISAPPLVFFGITFNGENYCRNVAANTTPLHTDWRLTSPGFNADHVRMNATNSNQITYAGSAVAGESVHIATIEHS
ncbi:hypothetical protein J5J86_13925 [Aquabacter sp. L1I39]|uniref:hypothetical protein n=1 Tax=Aquabacter sp. L1I39 TaxID=2820278 RepID=UPI001ADA81FF|nr:hypothetical protein [Aquabacter sp. L1I39]QTL01904.1 hypothetical protein J5J86_13925 [Aquabacter sp. L1I39]